MIAWVKCVGGTTLIAAVKCMYTFVHVGEWKKRKECVGVGVIVWVDVCNCMGEEGSLKVEQP